MNKKIVRWIFAFILSVGVFLPKGVFAANASISASTTYAYVGDNVTVTVNYFACTWNLRVSGSVNDVIAGADMNGNVGGSQSYTLSSATPGTFTVSLSGDVSDYDTDVTSYPTGSVTVTFAERPAPPPTPTPDPTPSGGGGGQQVNPVTDSRSGNTNLSKLAVDDYKLTKIDDTHYSLIVKNSITKIKIEAVAEDSKAVVSGMGEAPLAVGENSFMILVQAENGASKSYYLTITRKDNLYTVERFDEALEDEDQDVYVSLNPDDEITTDMMKKIKDSKKEVHFVQNGEENSILYTWIVDGKTLDQVSPMKSKIDFKFSDKDTFDELVGYRQGVYLTFPNQKYSKGVKTQIYVGDQYKDGDKVSLYTYDTKGKKTTLKQKDLVVKNGMVEFSVEGDKYFLTKADLEPAKVEKKVNPYAIVCVVEFILLLVFFGLVIYPRFKHIFKKETDVI